MLESAHVNVAGHILEEFASTMMNAILLHVRIMAHVQLISILTLFNSTGVLVLMVHLVSTVKTFQFNCLNNLLGHNIMTFKY